ncbi:MAG: hypothetical protein GEU81_07390 [Nitriliruptorales bacterium]|nr:hypothetical protein [Nitriliruptorales bacterium]
MLLLDDVALQRIADGGAPRQPQRQAAPEAVRPFLQSDVMFASIALIALSGYLLERVLVQVVEDRTVVRWGMVQEAGAR